VEILDRGGTALAVRYDFDFSGLADTPYSMPKPDSGLQSVRERLGAPGESTSGPVLQRFLDTAEDVVSLFEMFPGLDR
jgi:hypothetical protein